MRARRLPGNPILRPGMGARIGSNLNGPSLIRVPDWVEGALGRYYLYFADHRGDHIRLAWADMPEGPWTVYGPGALELADSGFPTRREDLRPRSEAGRRLVEAGLLVPHVASPEVCIDEERRELRMYFHGLLPDLSQQTRVAISRDGLAFGVRSELLTPSYLRVLRHDDRWYGMAMPGTLYRSADGLSGFERGPQLLGDDTRHVALLRSGREMRVLFSRVGDAPERILASRVRMEGDWLRWRAGQPEELLAPEESWEGAHLPLAPSVRGFAPGPVRQLRDPAVHREGDRTWLLYSVAGESGIAIAELELERGG